MIEYIVDRYSDIQNVLALQATIFALAGAIIVAMNKNMLVAHILYTVANVLFIFVYAFVQLWEPMFLSIGFLLTALYGCYIHYIKQSSLRRDVYGRQKR